MQKISVLDGLRGVAILLVAWHHLYLLGLGSGYDVGPLPLRLSGGIGFSGVELFFVLSGFLLFRPYARALLCAEPWPNTYQFYLHRVRRILPAFYTTLLILLVIFWRLIAPVRLDALLGLIVLDQNVHPASDFLANQIDSPLWTLAVEWQFYLLLPVLALGLKWLAERKDGQARLRFLAMGLGGVVLFGLLSRVLVGWLYYHTGQLPQNVPGGLGILVIILFGTSGRFLEVFALGMAASLVRTWTEARRFPRLGALACLLGLLGLGGCALWAEQAQRFSLTSSQVYLFPPAGAAWVLLGEWTLGLCFACLLLGSLLGAPAASSLFSWSPLRKIGVISFSMYLWHVPLLLALSQVARSFPAFILLGLAVVIVWSAAFYWVVERPFLRWRRANVKPSG
jgi:peptidoglycan/LPS O-acetylase OafA/YrhL